MKLIVGLGNPGKEYENTYHNVGFLAVSQFVDTLGESFSKKECNALTCHVTIAGEKVVFAKPQTFMNLSGDSVVALKNKYKLKSTDILVVLDDIDLPKGKTRYRETGSAGTHNGLRDIVARLATQEFPRIRIGIGKDDKMDLASYVLSKIDKESMIVLQEKFDEAMELLKENFLK